MVSCDMLVSSVRADRVAKNTFVMSQCHADLRGLGGKCVCVERETCWCKRGVSLVSGMIGGIV